MRYRFCDLVLESNTPLPELPDTLETDVSIAFELLEPGISLTQPTEWYHHRETNGGQIWLNFGRVEAGYVLRFSVYADFLIMDSGTRIQCVPRLGTPHNTIRHLFLDQVMPLVLSLRGDIVLHASAVAISGKAVAFIGDTGRGKSTIACYLTKAGHNLLTDDCLVVRRYGSDFVVHPTYPGLRVMPKSLASVWGGTVDLPDVAHYSRKKRLGPNIESFTFAQGPIPLGTLYFLVDPAWPAIPSENAAQITPMPPRDTLIELIRSSFRLDFQDRPRLAMELRNCHSLAKSAQFFWLAFCRNYTSLPAVCELIVQRRNW